MTQLREQLIKRVKEAGPFAEPSEIVDALNLTELVEAADALTMEFDTDYRPDKDMLDRYRTAREKCVGSKGHAGSQRCGWCGHYRKRNVNYDKACS